MTSRMRRLAIALSTTLVLALVSGCSAAQTTSRSAPDGVERAALAEAQLPAMRDGIPIALDVWTQLWTPIQAASQVQSCVSRGSGGVLEFRAAPLAQQSNGMSYDVATETNVSLGVIGDFNDDRAVQRLVDSCIALYPVDRRLWLVPEHDRGALYSYDATVLRRCLVAHGQQVPRVPSRVRFENLMRASAPWNAYDLVVVKDRAAWYALADACPVLPLAVAGDIASEQPSYP
ncbi:MAG: hypothetical protein ABIS08_11350 [Pseudolysinimonas sp.]